MISIRSFIVRQPLLYPLCRRCKDYVDLIAWHKSDKKGTIPHLMKEKIVKQYAQQYDMKVFIETGTYLGDMIYAMKDTFDKIYSIELDYNLYNMARLRFQHYNTVSLLNGCSSIVLKSLLNTISVPCLFWLDGHYCDGVMATGKSYGNTPIIDELTHILNHDIRDHVILIDDARCFTGTDGYPTIKEVEDIICSKYPSSMFDVKDDVIRIIVR